MDNDIEKTSESSMLHDSHGNLGGNSRIVYLFHVAYIGLHSSLRLPQWKTLCFSNSQPNRTKFFRFYICFHRKAPVSEVGAPSNKGWRPPTGNPGSAPDEYIVNTRRSILSQKCILIEQILM